MCYEFESYKNAASPLTTFIANSAITSDTELKSSTKQERHERRLAKARADQEVNRKLREAREAEHPQLETGKGYKWTLGDYMFAPFAFLVGGLNSLGDTSSGSYCSRYILSARQLTYEAKPYLQDGNKMDGYDFDHEALKYADNISFACVNAYMNEIE